MNMLRVLMDKVDSIQQQQMGNVSRVGNPTKAPKLNAKDIKNTLTEMKNAFDGIISRLNKELLSLKIS